nr:hypothetical protein [Tanacetum cinerariifolium]
MKKAIEVLEALNFSDFGIIHGVKTLQELDEFYRDHVVELDVNDVVVFQLGGLLRRMPIREFSLALGLYSAEEMNNNLYTFYHASCVKSRPSNYNPTPYLVESSTKKSYDSRHPLSYATIKNPICHLVHRELVDVPWHVVKFLCDKAKGVQKKSKIDVAKLSELCITRFNGLGQVEFVDDKLDDSDEKTNAAEARRAQKENKGSPRRCPNMKFTNRLRVMDDRLGSMRLEQKMFQSWNTRVQHGVDFMNNPQTYSVVPSTTHAYPFGLFDNPRDLPSNSRHPGSDMDEEWFLICV